MLLIEKLNKELNKKQILFFFLLALLIRVSIASQDLAYIDRLFLPDDTFYILAISENIYKGNGPSTDGIIQSNGFQPLITLFHAPLFFLSEDKNMIASMAIFESAIFGSISTIIIGLIALRLRNPLTALLAMVLWTFSPSIIQNDVNGLETSLSGLICLLIIYQLLKINEKKAYSRLVLIGFLCGLALQARVDSCFLVCLVGIYGLKHWGLKPVSIIVFAAIITVTPWWIYSYFTFGSIVPESGAAVKQIINILVTSNPQSWLVPIFAIVKLTEVYSVPGVGLMYQLTNTVLMICIILHATYRIVKVSHQKDSVLLLAISALILFLFYLFYLPAYWFFERYFYWIYAVLILLLALFLEQLIQQSQTEKKKFKLAALLIYFSYLTTTALMSFTFYFSQPESVPKINLSGAKGYRDAALKILQEIPENTVIGASQSGAINYYSGDARRVINLDGVVNHEAYLAIKNNTMDHYMRDNNIRYFADWEASLDFMQIVSNDKIASHCAKEIKAVEQGFMTYSLYDIEACMQDFK